MGQYSKDQIRDQNLAVLANLTDLAAGIIMEVAGNEISNQLNGQLISGARVRELVVAKTQAVLSKQTGGV